MDLSGTESREEEQEEEQEEEDAEAARNSAKIRVRLGGSIYLWSCGETEENGDAALKLPDILIGWLVLMVRRPRVQLYFQ